MMNRKQIAEAFNLGPDDELVYNATGQQVDNDAIVLRLFNLQLAGREHGREGFYPDGEFCSDADWCNGPGYEIGLLSDLLEIDDDSIGELYSDAHSHYFRDGTINPGERDWMPQIYDMQFGAYADTEISVHAKSFEDALEIAAEHLAKIEPGQFIEPDYAEATRDAGLLLCFPEGLTDEEELHISGEAETDLTYTESGWLASWEWFGSERA